MEIVDKLVQHTYNKIFFEKLHFLKTDLESIKKLILSNQKLLSSKIDRVLFISDLAEKLKSEKIDEAIKQRQTYGEVLMYDYKEIETLYNWLEANTNDKKEAFLNLLDTSCISTYKWEIEEEKLRLLFDKLRGNFISSDTSLEIFTFAFSGRPLKDVREKIEWLKYGKNKSVNKKSITDFLEILSSKEIISKPHHIKKNNEVEILNNLFSSKEGNLRFYNSNFVTPTIKSEYREELVSLVNSIL